MAKDVKAGEALKKVDADAHAATYDKNGDLAIKHNKPVAAVEGGEKGSADTGVEAKIQETVTGAAVAPIDTVDQGSVNEEARAAREPAKVETQDGVKEDTAGAESAQKAKEATLKSVGVDKTDAAKDAVESQKDNKAEQAKKDKSVATDQRVGK